jgi:serpin B
MRTAIILFLALILVIAGCSQKEIPPSGNQAQTPPVEEETPEPGNGGVEETRGDSALIDGNNRFALDMYSQLKSEEGNIFFSPYSVSSALAMAYEGARGSTAEEIRSVFHYPENTKERQEGYAALYNNINVNKAGYTLNTANALWVEKSYRLLASYTSTIEEYYSGKATNLDFITKTQESRQTINSWVEDHTNGKIKNLIRSLSTQTRLVITNAVYFKGTWLKEFDPEQTIEKNFWLTPAKTTKAEMMRSTDVFSYAETEEMQALELPYDGEKLSMLILLPSKEGLGDFEESLDVKKLNDIKALLQKQEVNVLLPKFRFEARYEMNDPLSELGMPTAFTAKANFSGMDGEGKLFISQVVHQAFVEANEEGTEAAAATAVVMVATAMPNEPATPTFNADHPFIFLIQDKETGNIIFLGRVSNPTYAAMQ